MRAFTGLHFTAELSCFGIITGDASVQLEMTVMSSTQFDFFAIGHVLKGIVGESIHNARLSYFDNTTSNRTPTTVSSENSSKGRRVDILKQ